VATEPDVTAAQLTLLSAVHEQYPGVKTSTLMVSPEAPTVKVGEEIV
jgi:hypothetical protein